MRIRSTRSIFPADQRGAGRGRCPSESEVRWKGWEKYRRGGVSRGWFPGNLRGASPFLWPAGHRGERLSPPGERRGLVRFRALRCGPARGRTARSRKGSTPSNRTVSPWGRWTVRSMTGEKNSTAGSVISLASVFSSMGPAGRSMEWVAFPFRNSTAWEKLERAAWAESAMPTAAATPQAIPSNWSTLRPRRRGR